MRVVWDFSATFHFNLFASFFRIMLFCTCFTPLLVLSGYPLELESVVQLVRCRLLTPVSRLDVASNVALFPSTCLLALDTTSVPNDKS